MNDRYAAIGLFVKYGRVIALGAALFVFAVAWAVIANCHQSFFWLVAAGVLSAAVGAGVLLLHDIVRVIAHTLIPEP